MIEGEKAPFDASIFYLDILIFQLVNQNGDGIEAVVCGRVARCHFTATRTHKNTQLYLWRRFLFSISGEFAPYNYISYWRFSIAKGQLVANNRQCFWS